MDTTEPQKKSNNFLSNFASTFAKQSMCSETATVQKPLSPPPETITTKSDGASASSLRTNVENAQSSGLLSQLDKFYYDDMVKSEESCDTPQGKVVTAAESSSSSLKTPVEEKIIIKSADNNDDNNKLEVTDDAKVPKKSPHSKTMTQRKLFDYFK